MLKGIKQTEYDDDGGGSVWYSLVSFRLKTMRSTKNCAFSSKRTTSERDWFV